MPKQMRQPVAKSGFKLPGNWTTINQQVLTEFAGSGGRKITQDVSKALFTEVVKRCGGTEQDAKDLWDFPVYD